MSPLLGTQRTSERAQLMSAFRGKVDIAKGRDTGAKREIVGVGFLMLWVRLILLTPSRSRRSTARRRLWDPHIGFRRFWVPALLVAHYLTFLVLLRGRWPA